MDKSELFSLHADACEKDHKCITSYDIAEFFRKYDRMEKMMEEAEKIKGGENGK